MSKGWHIATRLLIAVRSRCYQYFIGWETVVLTEFLQTEKDAIVDAWIDLIIAGYPAQSSHFLKEESDRFRNPVGFTIGAEANKLFTALLDNADESQLKASLDSIIKIRTVQDFSAAQAVHFIFLLKDAVRKTLSENGNKEVPFDELLAFESRIDRLALLAFDSYMQCRDRISEIRIQEIKRKSRFLLKRLHLQEESIWQEE